MFLAQNKFISQVLDPTSAHFTTYSSRSSLDLNTGLVSLPSDSLPDRMMVPFLLPKFVSWMLSLDFSLLLEQLLLVMMPWLAALQQQHLKHGSGRVHCNRLSTQLSSTLTKLPYCEAKQLPSLRDEASAEDQTCAIIPVGWAYWKS
jgi:hypothetical protein